MIGDLGSDVVNVTGDVFPDVVSQKTFPKAPHLLTALAGPLAVEGGETGADRSLWIALLLPAEKNAALFNVAAQPSESGQIDILDVFDDSRAIGGTGTFTSTGLTGLRHRRPARPSRFRPRSASRRAFPAALPSAPFA